MNPPSLTIGIEEEYQIVDPQTRELRSYITQILEEGKMTLREQVKPELHQAMVEVGSLVCQTPGELREELVRLRRTIMELAAKNGLKIVAAGTHPFSSWMTQEITPQERYMGVKQDMQELAQRLLIFGTHVHIGIEDREFLIDCMNVVRYLLPHILCLSSSSPFWMGRNTGLKSYRSIIFRNFPRSGIPRVFDTWEDFNYLVETLVKTNTIPDGSKIWWDVRPNHSYPTIEFRINDVCTRVDEAICIAAIFQAIIFKLWKLRRDNLTFRVYPMELIEENKWRAVRYGLDGKQVAVTVNHLHPRKRVDLFLESVHFASARVSGATALVVGGGPEEASLKALARRLGMKVGHDAIFTGAVHEDELPAHYALGNVYVHTGKEESFGLSVIEALHAGLPVVSVNEGGPCDTVQHGATGYLVPPTPDALGTALATLLADPERARRMGQAGAGFVNTHFSWEKGVDTLLGMMRDA